MPSVDGINYPGPFEVRLNYSTTVSELFNHQMRFNVDVDVDPGPGSTFDDYTLISRLGVTPQLDTWVDALVALLQPLYPAAAAFVNAELWLYESGTFNAAFQSSYSIGEVGTAGTGSTQWGQSITTFRSQNGSHARLTLMRPSLTINVTDTYPFLNANMQALADFITAQASPVLARDSGYLFSALNHMVGQNEAMFKKTNRP